MIIASDRRPTMQDVASVAGVSVQTVSNFVSGRYDKLSKPTQQKVRAAIDQLGYRINHAARGLRSSKTATLAFLAVDDTQRFLADPLTGDYLAGIGDVARESGYSVLVHSTHGDPEREEFLRPIEEGRVDAACVLLSGPQEVRRRLVQRLEDSRIDYVLFDEVEVAAGAKRARTVRSDQRAGAEALVDHLVERGHSKIGFIAAEVPWAVVEQRHQGYVTALERHGLAARTELSLFEAGGWEPSGAAAMVEKLLGLEDAPTALLCGSDLLALGATRCLHDNDVRVPADVAVCGFDDFDFSRQTSPALTTVAVPAWEMGRAAAQLLIDVLDGQGPGYRDVCLDTTLVVREST